MASTESASAAARTLPTLPVLASLLLAVAALACVEPAPVAPALPSSTAASAPVAPGRSTLLRDGGPNIEALEEQLRGLAKDAPERPRIVRRLADACVALEDRARRDKLVHDLRHDADPRADAEAVASKRAAEAVEGARRAAIRYYRVLAREYPAWCSGHGQDGGLGCGDEVLSHLAYELEEGHEMEDAYQAHRELITTFPQSRFVPLAYLALAEPLFEAAQRDPARAPLAEKAYQEVLRFPPPENRSAGIAHYKLAYVRWSRGDLAGALAEMTKAIEVCEAFPSPSGAQLAGAARREITALYAAAGDPRGAVAFFSRLSGESRGGVYRTPGDARCTGREVPGPRQACRRGRARPRLAGARRGREDLRAGRPHRPRSGEQGIDPGGAGAAATRGGGLRLAPGRAGAVREGAVSFGRARQPLATRASMAATTSSARVCHSPGVTRTTRQPRRRQKRGV